MSQPDETFFTVVSAPDGVDRETLAGLLTGELGIDVHTLRLRLRRPPPCIAGRVTRARAVAAARALRQAGGNAFCPSLADLSALGPVTKIREMSLAADGLAMTLWRSPPEHLPFDELQILVRASLADTKLAPQAPAGQRASRLLMSSPVAAGWA